MECNKQPYVQIAASAHRYPSSCWCRPFECTAVRQQCTSSNCSLNFWNSNAGSLFLSWDGPLMVILWDPVFKLVAGRPETLPRPEAEKYWASFPFLNFTHSPVWRRAEQREWQELALSLFFLSLLSLGLLNNYIFCSVSETTTMTFVQQQPPNLLALVTETEPENRF